MKKMNAMLAMATIFFAGVATTTTVHADEKPQGFQISPIMPESQNKDISGYFSVDWKPGAKEKFGLKLENNTEKELKYKVEFNKAVTNANGIIVYTENSENKDFEAMKWIKFPDEFTLKPGETKELMGEMNLPNEDLEGKLLGGLYIHEDLKIDKSKPEVTQTQSYAFPFSFRGNKEIDKGDITFGKFEIKQVGPRVFSVVAPFENNAKILSSTGTREIILKDMNGKEIFKEETPLEVAPLTKTNLSFEIKTPLTDDEYVSDITLKTKFGEFKESQTVKIPKEVKKNLNETYTQAAPEKDNTLLYVVIGVLVLIVLVLIIKNSRKNDNKNGQETKTVIDEKVTDETKPEEKVEEKPTNKTESKDNKKSSDE